MKLRNVYQNSDQINFMHVEEFVTDLFLEFGYFMRKSFERHLARLMMVFS